MKAVTLDEFNQLLETTPIKKRLKSELRFMTTAGELGEDDWDELELFAVPNRSGSAGILLLQPDDDLFVLPYEFSRRPASSTDGRQTPVICDLCKTYQSGRNIGMIGLKKDQRSANITWYLCCANLACSGHVRTKTSASRVSRAHLRENITDEQRVERLKARLRGILSSFHVTK